MSVKPKIGMLPRASAELVGNSGIGDIRWSSNIYYLLTKAGYEVTYLPASESSRCDLYLDVNSSEVCEEVGSTRHIHLSFYSQDLQRHPRKWVCADGNRTILGTCYRRTFEEDQERNLQHLNSVFARCLIQMSYCRFVVSLAFSEIP